MPTFARLTGAIAFAIVGYYIYATMVPLYGDDVIPNFLLPLCIATGLWAGWVLCGGPAQSIASGVGTGFTAIVAQVFWILTIENLVMMIQQSLRGRYDGPMDGMIGVFTLILEDLKEFGTPDMGVVLLTGAILAGALTGYVAKKHPS